MRAPPEDGARPDDGPLAATIDAADGTDPAADNAAAAADDAAAAGNDAGDADDEDEAYEPSLSIGDVLALLEAGGISIDRSDLASAALLRERVRLPQGGNVGSTQRARLRKAGVAAVRGIASAVNPDGEGTARMIAEALVPPPPLEERQRAAADRAVAANCVASYLDAKRRGLSKQERRQRLSALVPLTGRQGYTRPMLSREHNLKLTKCGGPYSRAQQLTTHAFALMLLTVPLAVCRTAPTVAVVVAAAIVSPLPPPAPMAGGGGAIRKQYRRVDCRP